MNEQDLSQVCAVLETVMRLLRERVIGVYHYGPGVLGELRPASDLDRFVILSGTTLLDERRALVSEIMRISARPRDVASGRPIDVTMTCRDELRPWPPKPRREFQYGEWLRRDYEAGFVPEPIVEPGLAPEVVTLLTASTSLIGPPVESLLDPVPHGELTRAMRDTVPALLDELTEDTVNVLLTLARIAFTFAHGRIVTKDEAAEWAAARLPADLRAPLAHARLVYLGEVPPAPQGFELNPLPTALRLVHQLIDPATDRQ